MNSVQGFVSSKLPHQLTKRCCLFMYLLGMYLLVCIGASFLPILYRHNCSQTLRSCLFLENFGFHSILH